MNTAADEARDKPAADAVSLALIGASINVRAMSVDDWKGIVFEAFRAARGDS